MGAKYLVHIFRCGVSSVWLVGVHLVLSDAVERLWPSQVLPLLPLPVLQAVVLQAHHGLDVWGYSTVRI